MNKVKTAVVAATILAASVAGCAPGNGDVPSATSVSSTPVSTLAIPGTGSGTESAHFVWQPDLGHEYGSDVANRNATGILDGEEGMLYFQAPNGNNGPLYSLYALNEATGEINELVTDCYGMINVLGDTVFYIGETDQGAFRYDTQTGSSTKLYDGVVQNLLATKDYLYIVNASSQLVQITVADGEQAKVCDGVARHFLQYLDGRVYFARLAPDEMNCNVCEVTVGLPASVAGVYESIPYPMSVVGTQVLYGDAKGTHLVDTDSGEERTLYGPEVRAGMPAVNGNGVFYITTDDDGYSELLVFDIDNATTIMLMPVHGGTIYFVDGEIFLVDPVDFDIEHVILDATDPRTELVLRGDGQVR